VGKSLIYAYSINGDVPTAASPADTPYTATATSYTAKTGVTGTRSWVVPTTLFAASPATPAFSATGFVAGAAGDVTSSKPTADCWVINDNNVLYNTQSGI